MSDCLSKEDIVAIAKKPVWPWLLDILPSLDNATREYILENTEDDGSEEYAAFRRVYEIPIASGDGKVSLDSYKKFYRE